jgi:hypothetical protein
MEQPPISSWSAAEMEGDTDDTFLSDGSNSTMFSTSSSLENISQVDSPMPVTPVNKRKSLPDSSSDTENTEKGNQTQKRQINPNLQTRRKPRPRLINKKNTVKMATKNQQNSIQIASLNVNVNGLVTPGKAEPLF